jgi:hypothetical protein
MIKITEQHNCSCLKCDQIPKTIIRIGVFYMCEKCCNEEFGERVAIDPESESGKIYYKWLKIYFNENLTITTEEGE